MKRFGTAEVYYHRKYLVEQKVADSLDAHVVAGIAADYLVATAIDDEVGEIGER